MPAHGMTQNGNPAGGEAGSLDKRVHRRQMVLETADMHGKVACRQMTGAPLPGPVDDQHIMTP